MKKLLIILSIIFTMPVIANCVNSYQVARDAQDLEYSASNFAFALNGTRLSHLSFDARRLQREASRLESMANGYSNCSRLRAQFSLVSNTFRNIQTTYRRNNGPRSGNLNFNFNRLSRDYRSLSSSVRYLNGRIRPRPTPRPRHPRTRPVPPRRGPRTRPAPPRHRRPTTRPGRTHRRPTRTSPRRGNGRRGRHNLV